MVEAENAEVATRRQSEISDSCSRTEAFASDLQAKLALSTIPALDGVRAIAVFLVIFYHFGFLRVPGGTGVTTFFVLSGFLITWLLVKEHERSGTISLKAFYFRRILRIFPAFYVYWFGFVFVLVIAGKPVLWPHAVASFFYLTNYYDALLGDPDTGFSHTWSLAIEEQFYLLWPLLLFRLRKNLQRMTIVLACITTGVWLHRLILYGVFDVKQEYFYAAFDTRMDALMMGCLLAVLLKRGVIMPFWKTLCLNQFMPLLVLAPLSLSIGCGQLWFPRYRDVVGLAVEPPLIALLIVQLISLSSLPAWQWVDSWGIRYLGRISYSLYLYQQITLGSVRRLLSDQPVLVQLIGAVAVTVLIASASYYLIERPLLKLKHGRGK